MFVVVGLMLLGVLCGFLFRKHRVASFVGGTVTLLIWLLLFFLGIEVGGDESVFNRLPSIGGIAASLSVAGVLGSVVLARVLWVWAEKRKRKG